MAAVEDRIAAGDEYDAPVPRDSPYGFVVRPKWVVGHVLALVAVIGFIDLGFWQLRRHDERSAVNDVMSERLGRPPTDLAELVARFGEDPEALEFRRTRVTGTYLPAEEVVWQARTRNGRSGHDVLTPMAVGDRAVVVDRGWVPIDISDPPVAGAEPTSLEATVVGVVRPGRVRQGLGHTDPDTGELDRISRVDLGRLQQQIEPELYPFYVLLQQQIPEQALDLPLPQDPPTPDAGPHLSYAVQWFLFATITAVGYPLLLSRTARDRSRRVRS